MSDASTTVPTETVLALAHELIRTPSDALAPGREEAAGRLLVDWFAAHRIEASLEPVSDGRANVLARIAGGPGPSLAWNGHLDTVPAGSMAEAFAPAVRGGMLHGRGACDMKGALAAMATAFVAVRESGLPLAGDLVFAATIDEESGSAGAGHWIAHGPLTDMAIVGEPTSLRLGVAHKGVSFIRVRLRGRAAHGSTPELGVNAALHGSRVALALLEQLGPELGRRQHRLLGCSTLNIGRLCGGTAPNIVAEACEIEVDRRYIPGEAPPIEEIGRIVMSTCGSVDGLTIELEEMPATSKIPHAPLSTDAGGRLATAAASALADRGLEPTPVGLSYWTDGGALSAAGVETIVLGPGTIARAHTAEECASVREIGLAAQLYLDIVRGLAATYRS